MASYLDKTGLTTLWSKMKSHVSNNYLSLTGGTVTGIVNFNNAVTINDANLYFNRSDLHFNTNLNGLTWTPTADGTRIYMRPDQDINLFQIVMVPSGGTAFEAFGLKTDGTPLFHKPLGISCGGTGANSAAAARTNLGITPANIGALSLSGGTLTGGLTVNSTINATNSIWARGSGQEIQVGTQSGAGNIYLYSHANASGVRGIHVVNPNGANTSIVTVSSDNIATFFGFATSAGNADSAVYANSAGAAAKLLSNSVPTFGIQGLEYFNSSLPSSGTATDSYAPTADWWHILRMNHGNDIGYYVDIGACFHQDYLAYRRVSGGADNGWVPLIDGHGGTINGNLSINGIINIGNAIQMYSNGEGANLILGSPNDISKQFQFDTHDQNLRLYYSTTSGNSVNGGYWVFQTDGTLVSSAFKGSLTGNATTASGLVITKANTSWKANTAGNIICYEGASTTTYDLPTGAVEILSMRHNGSRGVALGIGWASGGRGVWFNSLHDDTSQDQWLGWRRLVDSSQFSWNSSTSTLTITI